MYAVEVYHGYYSVCVCVCVCVFGTVINLCVREAAKNICACAIN